MTFDEVVVVTGAAGGIGAATTDVFSHAGYGVVAIDIDKSVLELGSCVGLKNVFGVVADHKDLESLAVPVAMASELGPVRHLAMFAGMSLPEETRLDGGRELPNPELFRESIDLNLLGHVNVLWSFQPLLFEQSGNRSVSLCSSVNALQGWGEPAYSAAKAGLIGMMHALTVGYGKRGIRINAVAPGTVSTPNTRVEWAHDPDHFTRMKEGIPLKKLGQPSDIAAMFLALARDLTHVTGQVIPVDGGQTIMR